jgi:hypothetical protein
MDEQGHSRTGLEFDDFARHLAADLDLDASALRPDATVTDDLGLDSMGCSSWSWWSRTSASTSATRSSMAS